MTFMRRPPRSGVDEDYDNRWIRRWEANDNANEGTDHEVSGDPGLAGGHVERPAVQGRCSRRGVGGLAGRVSVVCRAEDPGRAGRLPRPQWRRPGTVRARGGRGPSRYRDLRRGRAGLMRWDQPERDRVVFRIGSVFGRVVATIITLLFIPGASPVSPLARRGGHPACRAEPHIGRSALSENTRT